MRRHRETKESLGILTSSTIHSSKSPIKLLSMSSAYFQLIVRLLITLFVASYGRSKHAFGVRSSRALDVQRVSHAASVGGVGVFEAE